MNRNIILGILAAAGVVGTGVTSGIGSVKGYKHVTEQKEASKDLDQKEVALIYLKDLVPAIAVGTGTIVCVLSSTVFDTKTQRSIAGAYSLIDRSFREYRKKIADKYGKDEEKEVYNSVVRKCCSVSIPHDKAAPGQLLFYDEYSDRWFKRTMLEVADAEYHFNRNLALRGYAKLNELYEFLGLEPTEYGEYAGWNLYMGETEHGYQWVDFEHEYCEELAEEPDTPSFYILRIIQPPHTDYMEEDEYIQDPNFG